MSISAAERRAADARSRRGGAVAARPRARLSRAGRSLGTALAVAAFCLGTSPDPAPRVVEHRVRRGDTIAGLAVRYYGDKERAEILARINGIEDVRGLRPGRRLRIPLSAAYRVRPGDTPSELSEKLLGGASRHSALMELNGLQARSGLDAGTEIEIPVLLEHTIDRGETLGEVARRFYGDAGRAAWLAEFNGIEKADAIRQGTRLQVPLVGLLPARSSRPATTAPASGSRLASSDETKASPGAGVRSATQRQTREREDSSAGREARPRPEPGTGAGAPDPAVERAVALYHRGEYRRAAGLLEAALDSGALRGAEKARALRHRAYCAVATGDRGAARQAFRALRRIDPNWRPDPMEDSPKIRQFFSEAVSSRSSSGS